MILVLALLVIAVSMVSPRIAGFIRARSLESEARRLLAVTHAGRSRAVSEGTVVVLWLDSSQGHYGLEQEVPGRNGDAASLEFSADPNLQISFTTGTRLLGQTSTSPIPARSTGVRPPNRRNLPSIRLLPDGSIDTDSPQVVKIQDPEGSTLWMVEGSDRRHYEIRTTDP
jgi:hypothetical protein